MFSQLKCPCPAAGRLIMFKTSVLLRLKMLELSVMSLVLYRLEPLESCLEKAWIKRRPNKSADRVFVFDIMRLNTAKLTSRESVYTSFGKPREMDSI